MAAALASDDVLVAAADGKPHGARAALGAVVEARGPRRRRGASRRRGRAAPPVAAPPKAQATTSAAARRAAPPAAAPPRGAAAAESSDDDDDREDAYAYGGDAAGAAGEAATPEDEDYDEDALFGASLAAVAAPRVERVRPLRAPGQGAQQPEPQGAVRGVKEEDDLRLLRGRGRAGRGPAPDAAGHAVALSLAGYVVSASARPCAFDERSPSTIRVFSPNDARPLATRDEPRRVSALALSRSGEFCLRAFAGRRVSLAYDDDDDAETAVVAWKSAAADFLNARDWRGLEVARGETPVRPAVEGRRGVASGYAQEERDEGGS
ncbi:hypothetical protein JL722_6848 [Aureococcus anophagefferens]|nr:hypothetical protein JL722_6848 [Aureococcus anophagefferens]